MTCSLCHAENAEGSFSCSQCGSAFASSAEAPTLLDADITAPAVSPGRQKLSTGASWVTSGMTADLEPGSDFGPRYTIQAVLGRGGMGAVYKAYDKDLDRVVALKLVRPGLTTDPEVMQRFRQELLLASKITHKNVLRIHDLGDVNGLKFISMAYVDGEDLAHMLKAQGRWSADKAIELARQLCGALGAADAEGVVHRDLKPQNILIDHAGNAYVSDFGLAKSLEAGAAMMTHTGQLLGTPRYMSPEQVEGKPADHRSDIYAMGLILYETVTGDVPFTGESTLQVMYQRLKEDPANPKVLHPELPNHLVRIILRCLERDPERRYQTAQEILHDLDTPGAHVSLRNLAIAIRHPKRKSAWVLAAVAGLALTVALAVPSIRNYFFHPGASTAGTGGLKGIPSLAQGKYIAVLPFKVLGDASLGYVGEGLQEALAAKLFQLQDVHLLSTETSRSGSAGASLDQVAHDLNANLILEGTVQESGGRIAIVTNLHDMANGKLLWSQEFPGVPGDLLTLEDDIYSRLVTVLKLSPSDEELALATRHPTENLAAYDLYLKGRDAMRGTQDPKNIEAAIDYYHEALQKDSGFALAYAGLADACRVMYFEKRDHTWAEKALEAAQQAERLDDNLPEVHFSLGSVYTATGKTAEAITELSRALELAPNSDEAYRRLGAAYMDAGRKNEAIRAFEKAVDLNPYYWLNDRELGQAYFQIGNNDKALAAWQKIIQLEPENFEGYQDVGAVYLTEGKYSDCIPMFQKALQLNPTAEGNYSDLGTAYFYLKRYDEAVQMFLKAKELSPNDQVVIGNLGDAYRWSGQRDKADAAYDLAISLAFKDLEVNPRDANALQSLALYYAKKGQFAWAQDYIHKARAIDPNNVYCVYNEAVVDALAGKQQDALKALREAFEKGYSVDQARNDPELNSLRGIPEFERLMSKSTGKPS